jgi:prefoldin subunit 5
MPAAYPQGGMDAEAERRALQDEAAALRRQMDTIEQRLSSMTAGSKNE